MFGFILGHSIYTMKYNIFTDLYGQAAQVTIQDTSDCYSPDTVNSSLSNTTLYR